MVITQKGVIPNPRGGHEERISKASQKLVMKMMYKGL